MASTFTAVYDACVLYPNLLRSLLMDLALTDLYRARWSSDIHDEWIRNVREDRPDIPEEKLLRVRDLMDSHVRDALVTGYEGLIPGLPLPDPDDRHVLAAAIRCSASVIVTFNLNDFPPDVLEPYEVDAQHPDDFISNLIDLHPNQTLLAVRTSFSRNVRPPIDFNEYLEALFRLQLTQTSSMLRSLYY